MSAEIRKLRETISGLEAIRDSLRDKISAQNDLRAELRTAERALVEAHNELTRKERDV